MTNITELLAHLPDGLPNLHVTAIQHDGRQSTFASDNAEHLLPWAYLKQAKLHNGEGDVVIIVRRFLDKQSPMLGCPMKELTIAVASSDSVSFPSKGDITGAYTIDAATGEPLDHPQDLIFKSWGEMIGTDLPIDSIQ